MTGYEFYGYMNPSTDKYWGSSISQTYYIQGTTCDITYKKTYWSGDADLVGSVGMYIGDNSFSSDFLSFTVWMSNWNSHAGYIV